jgi:hypothetical protein
MDHSKDPDYPRMEKKNGVFYYENQLYEYLNNKDFTADNLEKKLHSLSFFGMGFLIEATIDPATAEKQFVNKAVFENLAANIRMAFIGVYDDESYLLAF